MPAPANLASYVGSLKRSLGLADWRVDVSEDRCSPEYDAFVTVVPLQRWAIIEAGPDWEDKGPDDQRASVVHELLHLHVDAAVQVLRRNLPDVEANRIIQNEHLSAIEHAVDAIAVAVAPLLEEP